jgi:ferredoxin
MSDAAGATRWRLEVDQQTCIGSGLCAGTSPDYFELGDTAARPIAEKVDPEDSVVDAAESCPVEAIKVFDDADGTLIAPTL